MDDLEKKPELDQASSEPMGRRFAGELLPRLIRQCLPPPMGAIFEAIEACSSADELAEKFDLLKKYVDDSKFDVPVIPLEVDVCLPSVVILNFDRLLSPDEISHLQAYLQDYDEFDWVCEIAVDDRCAIFNLHAPDDKDTVEEELVKPAKPILDDFGIKIKSIIYG